MKRFTKFLETKLNEELLKGEEAKKALLALPGTRRLPPQVTDTRPMAAQREGEEYRRYYDLMKDFLKNNLSVNASLPDTEDEVAFVDNPEKDEKPIRSFMTRADDISRQRGSIEPTKFDNLDFASLLLALHALPKIRSGMTTVTRSPEEVLSLQNILKDAQRAGIIEGPGI